MTTIKIDKLSNEILQGLKEYANLATDDLKKSIRTEKIKVKIRNPMN